MIVSSAYKKSATLSVARGRGIRWKESRAGPLSLRAKYYDMNTRIMLYGIGIFLTVVSLLLEFSFDSTQVLMRTDKTIFSKVEIEEFYQDYSRPDSNGTKFKGDDFLGQITFLIPRIRQIEPKPLSMEFAWSQKMTGEKWGQRNYTTTKGELLYYDGYSVKFESKKVEYVFNRTEEIWSSERRTTLKKSAAHLLNYSLIDYGEPQAVRYNIDQKFENIMLRRMGHFVSVHGDLATIFKSGKTSCIHQSA